MKNGWNHGEYGKVLVFAFLMMVSFLFVTNPVQASVVSLQSGDDVQNAVRKADPQDTIELKKGIYQGPIVVTKPLTIIGQEGATIDGGKNGTVITVRANNVTIKGLTIQNSGRNEVDSGLLLQKTKSAVIENNRFRNVHFGIYIKNGCGNKISGNHISSYSGHFSKRGNGIHLFKGEGNTIENNIIRQVQDGIYFDFAQKANAIGNQIFDSRYGMHYMFSRSILTKDNRVESNITGFMIMDSSNLEYERNRVFDQFHFRGFGVLIYDSKNIQLRENEIVQNSVGLSLEKAENTEITNNVIADNQVGLEFRKENRNNFFSENNFMANIVSSTIGNEELRLDNGTRGNYWDDYKSYDITGDGVGEVPYKAGSLYDHLLKRQPLWQFFFESPAIVLWSKAESMFPSLGSVEVYDYKPLVVPVNLDFEDADKGESNHLLPGSLAFVFITVSVLIILRGRKYQ